MIQNDIDTGINSNKKKNYITIFFITSSFIENLPKPWLVNILSNNAVLLGESGDAIIWLSHPPDGSTDGVDLGGVAHAPGDGVYLGDVNLDGGMVLGVDQSVAGGAETWEEIYFNTLSKQVMKDYSC